ncbi:MAG: Holliday junction branch migration protein RuvA [Alicyclobacillus sp.]|nr:Holliday junction branch migration protein RuvA [Alicyclobacillus sp.]
MMVFVRGEVRDVGKGHVDVEVHGLGFRLWVTDACAARLQPGSQVFLFTWTQVREDGWALYGFTSAEERDWFERLLGVSGIGPKLALQILNHATPAELVAAVTAEDTAFLSSVPGIGKKTAQRLVLELKDKVHQFSVAVSARSGRTEATGVGPADRAAAGRLASDVVEALVALGYHERYVVDLVRRAVEQEPAWGIEQVLRWCLQQLAR